MTSTLEREARRLPAGERRAMLAGALDRSNHDQRLVLALLLVERLSAAEAANVLGVPVRNVRGSYREILADLRRALRGGTSLAGPRRHGLRLALERFRKAS